MHWLALLCFTLNLSHIDVFLLSLSDEEEPQKTSYQG
jgi:hypothetical protein